MLAGRPTAYRAAGACDRLPRKDPDVNRNGKPHRHRCTLVLAAGLLLCSAATVEAQGKLEARYTASLAGIPLGKGAWIIDIADNEYVAAASGTTTGLARVFTGGNGSGAARGDFVGGNFVPLSYSVSIATEKRTEEVRMSLANGTVKEFAVSPETPLSPRAVPLTETHRRGVIDPMTASLTRVAGNGDPLTPEACNRSLAIFDGRMRYDLDFAFKRLDRVKAERGYAGPVVVCAVYFSPVAGHIPDRAAIKYLTRQRDMEVWLAPVSGTRVLVPFRFSVPTPLGTGVLEATQFVSTPLPSKANVKTQ